MTRQSVATLCPECADGQHADCSNLATVPVRGFPDEVQVALCTCLCVAVGHKDVTP